MDSDRSEFKTLWILPTNRREHVIQSTQMAQLHSNPTMIAPIWTKVSRTPWQTSADLCQGYGRKMQNTSISHDAPAFFINPDRVAHENRHNPNNIPVFSSKKSRLFKDLIPEASHVLPGGISILEATRSRSMTALPKTKLVPYGKQSFQMEVLKNPARHRFVNTGVTTNIRPSTSRSREQTSRLPPVPTQQGINKSHSNQNSARSRSNKS